MGRWLLLGVVACAPVAAPRTAVTPPAPLPVPAVTGGAPRPTTFPVGAPLAAVPRALDVPYAGVAVAWSYPLADWKPAIVDHRLVVIEERLESRTAQRFAVLDVATGEVLSRGSFPRGSALSPGDWPTPPFAWDVTDQGGRSALVGVDLTRQAIRWRVPRQALWLALGSFADGTVLAASDPGAARVRVGRLDPASGGLHEYPAAPGLWRMHGRVAVVAGETLVLALAVGAPVRQFLDEEARGLGHSVPPPNGLHALALGTGEQLWSREGEEIAALVGDADHVFVRYRHGGYAVLDAHTGAMEQRRRRSIGCFWPEAFVDEVVVGDVCGDETGSAGLDVRSGQTRWRSPLRVGAIAADVVLLHDRQRLARPAAVGSGEPVWGGAPIPPDVLAVAAAGERWLIGTMQSTLVGFRLTREPVAPVRVTVRGVVLVDETPWAKARVVVGEAAAVTDADGRFSVEVPLTTVLYARVAEEYVRAQAPVLRNDAGVYEVQLQAGGS